MDAPWRTWVLVISILYINSLCRVLVSGYICVILYLAGREFRYAL